MKKVFIFSALLFVSELACACGSNLQRESMARRLYADADMQKFVCASDSCSIGKFKGGLQFHQYNEQYHKKTLFVCIIEPTLSSTNSYTGVFASTGGDFEFQFISYGTGVNVGVNGGGIPIISEYSYIDPDNPDNSVNQYLWNGRAFIFARNVKLPK